MADSKKDTQADVTDEKIDIDAAEETGASGVEGSDADQVVDTATDDEAQTDLVDAKDDAPEDDPADDFDDAKTDIEPIEDDAPIAAEPEFTPQPAPTPEASKSSGFGATVLGGLVVAALGFGGVTYATGTWPFDAGKTDAMAEALKAQDTRLTALTESLQQLNDNMANQTGGDALAAALAKTEESLGARFDQLGGEMGTMSERLAVIDTRLTEVEKRPITSAPDVSGAISAYERELKELRTDLESQRGQNEEIAAIADKAKSEIAETTSRAAMMRLRAALESGGSFAAALGDLGVDAPEALSAVSGTGVATLATLKADFPEAARAALSASLRENTGEDTGSKLGNFFRSQLGVRSLAPREGNDPDAILSRVEAALSEGRLADALAEADALPDSGKAALADWAGAARARADAQAAAAALSDQLNMN